MDWETITAFARNIPIDWLLIGGFAASAALDTIRSGAGRVMALSLALPAAMLLASVFGVAAYLGILAEQMATPLLEAMLFLILFAALYLLIRRMDPSSGSGFGQSLHGVFAGCAATSILLVVWLQVPGLEAVWAFGPHVTALFSGPYAFWWLVGSYATLAFIRS